MPKWLQVLVGVLIVLVLIWFVVVHFSVHN